MLIVWTDDYFIVRRLGSSLCGISHNDFRPKQVVISYEEFIDFLGGTLSEIETKKEYLIREFINNKIIITIT